MGLNNRTAANAKSRAKYRAKNGLDPMSGATILSMDTPPRPVKSLKTATKTQNPDRLSEVLKGIPVPDSYNGKVAKPTFINGQFKLHELTIGDARRIYSPSKTEYPRIRSNIWIEAKKCGIKLTSRLIDENGHRFLYVWRTV